MVSHVFAETGDPPTWLAQRCLPSLIIVFSPHDDRDRARDSKPVWNNRTNADGVHRDAVGPHLMSFLPHVRFQLWHWWPVL